MLRAWSWLHLVSSLQSTNDSVLAVGFSPRDSSCIITSGKSHVHFWNWSIGVGVPAANGTLSRKQGVFGVRLWLSGRWGVDGDGGGVVRSTAETLWLGPSH